MNVSFNPQRIHSGVRASVAQGLRSAALALLLAMGITAVSAEAEETAKASFTNTDKTKLETMLMSHMQRIVDRQTRLEGQEKYIKVKSVRYNIDEAIIYVDLGKAYVPRRHSAEFLDSLRELNLEITDAVWDSISLNGVRFLYNGKGIYYYFPDEPQQPARSGKTGAAANMTAAPLIVVSAGHGAYYNYGSPAFGVARWTEQRDPYNGIIEDYVTPGYAIELSNWLISRSGAMTAFTRSFNETTHTPSDRPWWKVAARYHLASLYPDHPSIWHSRPNDTNNDRELKEDWQSRPYLANHLGAQTLLHVHTNGSPDTAATGTRVFFQTGRAADKPLGDSILCYMKELIHANPAYANFTVASTASEDDNAETRLATMRTVVVETAFHTNPNDALALQDPAFRTAAMKGVEKGYRLNAAGKTTCEPFKISSIPNVTGPYRVSMPVLVNYVGYPQFPVKIKVDYVTCPYPWTCKGFEKSVATEVPSPLSYNVICNADPRPPATFKIKTTLTDADGVKTNTVEHSYTCATPAAAKQIIDTVPAGRPTTGAGRG